VEFAMLGDDLGTQLAPLIGPQMVEEFLVPEYERLFGLYRQRGVLIWFHSCGYIEPFLDLFMRLGVNVLNPVQATANDLDRLRARTAGRMALHGAVSSATVMEGPPERITREVRERLWQLGRTGGYFCAPDQGLPFPEAHVSALREAVERYGRYPLAAP
jgi:uroporphyrinogen decarboxylase